MSNDSTGKLPVRDIAIRGSALAAMVTVPSLCIFAVLWMLLDDLFVAAIIGGMVHFVIMGFSLKISKKFLFRKN